MEILILSCGTGGGHNAAGKAVADELRRRGHQVTFTDPYLLAGRNVANLVSDSYVSGSSSARRGCLARCIPWASLTVSFRSIRRYTG